MAVINLNQRKGGSSDKEFILLPSDIYRMKVTKAVVEENRFADVQKDGTRPQQLVLTWEVTQLTDEQKEAAEKQRIADRVQAALWRKANGIANPVATEAETATATPG